MPLSTTGVGWMASALLVPVPRPIPNRKTVTNWMLRDTPYNVNMGR